MTLLLALALLGQEEPVESLIRKLGSDSFHEREKAAAELKRRGDAAMDSLQKAEKTAGEPAEKARLRRALEEVLGFRPLTPERLRATRLTCKLGAVKVRTAAAELARLSGLPVEIDGPADADPVISELEGSDVPLEGLLDSLARQASALWLIDGRRVLLVLAGKVPLRLFDVRDLTSPVDDEPRLLMEPDESDGPALVSESLPPYTGEDLAIIVRNDVSPKGWQEADGKSIQYQNGFLIIRNDAEVLRAIDAQLDRYRRKGLIDVRIELDAYAVKAGRKVEEASIERLRDEAAEGKTARRVASFDRTTRDKRQVGLGSLTRTVLVTGHDGSGAPVTAPFSTGTKINLRASLDHDRATLRVDFEGGWSRLLSVEKKKAEAGEVHVPTFANHVLRLSMGVPAGRFTVLGRIGESRIVDGLTDIVVVGRFTAVERP